MKIIEPSVEILNPPDYQTMLRHIELSGRTCYKSEDKITDVSAESFIRRIIDKKHLSVCEHYNISVRFVCDRGVSHQLVRHRLCSFSQESQRFCNYSGDKFGNEITVIRPVFWDDKTSSNSDKRSKYIAWKNVMSMAEDNYFWLIDTGASPQEARSVLPNSLKTEIVVTANIRQWRTMFEQRCTAAAHPQMRQVMIPLLGYFMDFYPVFFKDLSELYANGFKYFTDKSWQLADVKIDPDIKSHPFCEACLKKEQYKMLVEMHKEGFFDT